MPSPAEGEFLFEIDEGPSAECLTALGGVPFFARTVCSLDVPRSAKRNPALKQRDRGFDEATYMELLGIECAGRKLPGGLRSSAGRPGLGGDAGI